MDKILVDMIKKDGYYNYLKDNSFYVKNLTRDSSKYYEFKEFVKHKYHLRTVDKISEVLDDIELVSEVVKVLK